VHDGAGTVDASNDVGHAGLVSAKGSEVTGCGWIIVLGEGANATGVVLGSFLGEETERAGAGGFEFTVGHG
jgi:hypothetical protein